MVAAANETSFVEALDSFTKMGASLGEAVAELNKAARSKAHAGADGRTVGFYEGGESIAVNEAGEYDDGGQWTPRGLTKKARAKLAKGYKNEAFPTFGSWLKELAEAKQRGGSAADEFEKKHGSAFKGMSPKQLGGNSDVAITKAVQGMSIQEGQSAGYMVLPEFNNNIIERIYQNNIWSQTDQYTVNNNMVFLANAETSRATGSRYGGLQGYWVDEASNLTKSKPKFRRIELTLKKLAVLVYLTDELLADGGAALEAYVTRLAAREFNFMLGDAVFNGSGVQQPLGIINSPALLSISKETGQQAGTIVTENLDKMWARRFVAGNYSWYHNQDCGPQLDRLTQDIGTAGISLNRPNNSIASVMNQTIKSAPRIETEFNQTVGTTGDINLADFGQYLTISKGGINQAYSTHVEFLTDQVALKLTMRVNGRPWETTPTTPYKGSNTQASFLSLATRS